MDVTSPLTDHYPLWLAIPLAFGIVLATAAVVAIPIAIVRHVQRRAIRAQLHADEKEWLLAHPVAPATSPSLGRLTVRSRQASARSPQSRGQATPSSPEAVAAADDGVAPPASMSECFLQSDIDQAATGRAVQLPRPARPVAPKTTWGAA